MSNSQITLQNTILADAMRYLYDLVEKIQRVPVEYNHPTSTSKDVQYRYQLANVRFIQPNRIVADERFTIIPEGGPCQTPSYKDAIDFKGWQLRMNTVRIDAEYMQHYETFIDFIWGNLKENFGQAVQPATVGDGQPMKATGKGSRGPNPGTPEACRLTMISWLVDGISQRIACDRNNISAKTLRSNIENTLDAAEPETRAKWIKMLRQLHKEKLLGKYK